MRLQDRPASPQVNATTGFSAPTRRTDRGMLTDLAYEDESMAGLIAWSAPGIPAGT